MDKVIVLVALEKELPQMVLPNFHIEYTGVGKVNAAFKTSELIHQFSPKTIINYGTAGSLRRDLKGLVEVSSFFQRDMDVSALGLEVGKTPFDEISEISFGREGFSCGSGDSFVTELPQLDTDLVDMEAYAIAKVCFYKNVDFLCFKYISDNADENASESWGKNISHGQDLFRTKILELSST
ncbi:MAG: 5'-methylthioadenosine nucleosidase [Chloroflexi bacterium]|nr:5'-methylthioadenosine nucleosidase [Chloroflexota bacterium]|tara:strand:- start:6327 stop:6872 length:546 start_codon:yes stop_codon:yes gene_type:complete